MDDLSPSDLKTILHSKRANMYYLEYCRVMQKDGRVLYLTEADKKNLYFNIPIANTTVLMLGNGTSITQAAMRMLSQAGVLVGFCGGERLITTFVHCRTGSLETPDSMESNSRQSSPRRRGSILQHMPSA